PSICDKPFERFRWQKFVSVSSFYSAVGMKPTNTPPSKSDRGLFFVSLLIFLGTCLLVYGVISSRGRSAVIDPTSTPAQVMTLEPAIIANMTTVPSGVTGDLSVQVDTVERMLNECADFGTERRQQMQQHIAWLRNPGDIPRDLLPAFGA